ncbi:hypothetical protein D6C00_06530 [Thiohalobacter thiocyanaticus]|uniref:Uncharacterized protein n=1 Tax=Thiohalobacter thiocyanaticus TaxID=585455 RepID=A0A426QIR0_9GAMM|nr:hypothetical protein D6C00_06530 [Thiohalobacter thiocyanaticus]
MVVLLGWSLNEYRHMTCAWHGCKSLVRAFAPCPTRIADDADQALVESGPIAIVQGMKFRLATAVLVTVGDTVVLLTKKPALETSCNLVALLPQELCS